MSDLISSLNMAARALAAQQVGLDAAGQNIANVNTPGYTRRVVNFVAVPPRGPLSAGDGVEVQGIQGERAPFVEGRINAEQPIVSREQAIIDSLDVIQASIGTTGSSIDQALGAFYDSFATLAQDPTSSSARYQVAAQGQSLAKSFNDIAGRLVAAQHDADNQIRNAAGQVNELTAHLATLNTELAGAPEAVAETLRDDQSATLQKLSQLIDFTSVPHADGSIDVLAGNGQTVVAQGFSYQITAVSQPPNGFADLQINGTSATTGITGGQIGGLIHVRDVLIPGYQSQLDNLAYGVAASVNTAHLAGFDLNGNPGVNFFTPIGAPAGAAAAITINPAILANTQLIAAGGAAVPGDNQNARAISNLRGSTITGGTANPLDTWSALVYQVGTDTQASQQEQSGRSEIVKQLQALRDQYSGVSLDEEAASIMKFQSAYQANAKYFGAVSQTIDTLMAMVTAIP
jgi:flagellar hook-associated protein 1 FlgK